MSGKPSKSLAGHVMKEVVHGMAAEVRLPPHLAQQETSTLETRRSNPAQLSLGAR